MLDMNTGLYQTGVDSAGADISITLSAKAKPGRWSIGGIAWSYTASDTAGTAISAGVDIYATPSDTASISDTAAAGASKVFSVDVNLANADSIIPAEPFKFAPGYAVRIILRGGGDDVDRKLNVLGAKLV